MTAVMCGGFPARRCSSQGSTESRSSSAGVQCSGVHQDLPQIADVVPLREGVEASVGDPTALGGEPAQEFGPGGGVEPVQNLFGCAVLQEQGAYSGQLRVQVAVRAAQQGIDAFLHHTGQAVFTGHEQVDPAAAQAAPVASVVRTGPAHAAAGGVDADERAAVAAGSACGGRAPQRLVAGIADWPQRQSCAHLFGLPATSAGVCRALSGVAGGTDRAAQGGTAHARLVLPAAGALRRRWGPTAVADPAIRPPVVDAYRPRHAPALAALALPAPVVTAWTQRSVLGDRVGPLILTTAGRAGVVLARPAVLAQRLALNPVGDPSQPAARSALAPQRHIAVLAAGTDHAAVLAERGMAQFTAAHTRLEVRPVITAGARGSAPDSVRQPAHRAAPCATRSLH